ncbi:MAG: SpoIID/LytB domain-containing protein [bacterium]|nr:SpoIID/LytB domain-containing protein [bacterium]
MISNYLIKDGNLILYIDYNYEIGFFKNKKLSFKNSITNYIKDHKIKFTGQILLVIGSILLATFNYDNNVLTLNKINKDANENIIYTMPFEDLNYIPEVKKNVENNNSSNNTKINKNTNNSLISSNNKTNNNKSNSNTNTNKSSSNNTSSNSKSAISNTSNTSEKNTNMVTIYRSNGKIITLDLEEYLIGVVAGEMPASFNMEALKAQAVLARTYALKSIKANKKLTDTTSTQVYIDNNEMKSKWGSDYNKYYSKIKQEVE